MPAVIFPEEVPHGEDDDDSGLGHGVTTPMLVTNEQPSAAVVGYNNDRMTLHENPLYKPPPMAQATLLSNTTANTANYTNSIITPQSTTMATFSTSLPTHKISSPLPPRTPPGATIVHNPNQRLPPPYVAAI